jgi:hypothetical protein
MAKVGLTARQVSLVVVSHAQRLNEVTQHVDQLWHNAKARRVKQPLRKRHLKSA